MSIPSGAGEGAAKAWYLPLVLLWESLSALVMSAFSLSCQILVMFEVHWPMKGISLKHVLGWGVEEVRGVI